MNESGKLYLIPSTIAEDTQAAVISPQVRAALENISYFLAEEVRTARRFLSSLKIYASIEPLSFEVLNKDTKPSELHALFAPIRNGHNLGVISEAGCPGVADPGALAVSYAHQQRIKVVPLVGPSALLLALMASGLNGQKFAFHGYIPVAAKEAAKVIRELEKESQLKNQTQLFIETPYRNNQVLAHLLNNLQPRTELSIAVALSGANESVLTQSIKEWKAAKIILPKAPAIFSFLATLSN